MIYKLDIIPFSSALVNLDLAAFIHSNGLKKGVMMSHKPPRLYEYKLKGINALSNEIDFIGWEECLDFVYYPFKKLIICAIKTSEDIAQLYTLDVRDYTTVSTGIKIPIMFECPRMIKSSGGQFYARTEVYQVTVYFKMDQNLNTRILKVDLEEEDSIIADFEPVGLNRLLIVSVDGKFSYYEFNLRMASFGKINKKERFSVRLKDGEQCNVVTMCSKAQYAGVGTLMDDGEKRRLGKLYIYHVSDFGVFEMRDVIDFNKSQYAIHDGSFFGSLTMSLYYGEYPLVFACQTEGQGMMLSFKFNGKKLIRYHSPIKLYNAKSYMMSKSGSILTTVDYAGNISVIKF